MPHRPSRLSRRPALPLTLALLAATALTTAGCRGASAEAIPEPAPAIAVRTAAVERGPVHRPVRAAGTVHAKDEWKLAFKTGGVLARLLVDEGQPIRRGQVLATLDATELSAGARQARESLAKAERERARARSLGEADVIPRAVAEDAETAVAVAAAGARAAEFNLRNAALVAPDDGWVERRLAEPGEIVGPGQAVLEVSGSGRGFVVRASLADRDVLGLARGTAATVTLDARPGERLRGHVAEIARSAARGTGTYDIEVRLAPDLPALLGGLTAKVEIERTVDAPASVPLAAVQEGDGASGAVFVAEQGAARRVPVRIAFLQGERAVLASELPADAVITDGASRLADGTAVTVVP
jgi:RND family efflux transporter MFP subunit